MCNIQSGVILTCHLCFCIAWKSLSIALWLLHFRGIVHECMISIITATYLSRVWCLSLLLIHFYNARVKPCLKLQVCNEMKKVVNNFPLIVWNNMFELVTKLLITLLNQYVKFTGYVQNCTFLTQFWVYILLVSIEFTIIWCTMPI